MPAKDALTFGRIHLFTTGSQGTIESLRVRVGQSLVALKTMVDDHWAVPLSPRYLHLILFLRALGGRRRLDSILGQTLCVHRENLVANL